MKLGDIRKLGSNLKKLQVSGSVIYLDRISSASVVVHEHGHKVCQDLFYKPGNTALQFDGVDNIKNFLNNPTMDNWLKVITKYDVGQDNASGWAAYSARDGLTDIGKKLGYKGSDAIMTAAGCGSVELIALGVFVAGYKIRKEHPLLGSTLMIYSTYLHIVNSVYALSALVLKPEDFPGHDWIWFSQVTGLHPIIVGITMTSLLPCLFLSLKLIERHRANKVLRRQALLNLIGTKISEEKFERYFKGYQHRDKLESLAEKLYNHMKETGAVSKDGKLDPKNVDRETIKLFRKLTAEYNKFLDTVIKSEKKLVDTEVERIKKTTQIRKHPSLEKLKSTVKEASQNKLKLLGEVTAVGGIIGMLMTTAGFGVGSMVPVTIPLSLLITSSGFKVADKIRDLKTNWANISKRMKVSALTSLCLTIGLGGIIATSLFGVLSNG